MTKQERLIVTSWTGVLMVDFDDFHGYAEGLLCRRILSHEFSGSGLWEELKYAVRDDFMKLCKG